MSYNPHPFAVNLPTGAVPLPSHSLPHPEQFALFSPISSPHEYTAVVPARATYSHSASLSNRYSLPVFSPRKPLHVPLRVLPAYALITGRFRDLLISRSPSQLRPPSTFHFPSPRIPLPTRHLRLLPPQTSPVSNSSYAVAALPHTSPPQMPSLSAPRAVAPRPHPYPPPPPAIPSYTPPAGTTTIHGHHPSSHARNSSPTRRWLPSTFNAAACSRVR